MTALQSSVLYVGDFRVDPALDEIAKDGITSKIEPRTMRLLVCLAERAGQVVSVEQLLDLVWKDVVVSTDSVYQAVASLRRILGDDPKEPKYIANVMRRGYRLVAAVKELDPEPATSAPATVGPADPRRKPRFVWLLLTVVLVVCAALAYLMADRFWLSRHTGTSAGDTVARTTAEPAAAAFSPPPHSIAVLPFVNISGDQEQEYFSDGLTEELLNSLSRINELQVAAHTSSFSFRGEHPDIATVAHKLNVAAVLEGSVRRSAHTVRITAQLVSGVTGFHLWSETYDRELVDVLKLQTEIAIAVADALEVTVLGDEASKIELGETHDPAALDAYLRASKAYWQEKVEAAINGYTEAIRLDSHYALAYADRSIAFTYTDDDATPAIHSQLVRAKADAVKAIALAPNLSEGHLALALVYEGLLAFPSATEEFERALALGAGNARILRDYGLFAVFMGRGDFGLDLLHRALALDPLSPNSTGHLANALFFLRRYPEARVRYEEGASNGPTAMIGFAYYLEGDFENARSVCEKSPEVGMRETCLAMTYDKLGRRADAEAVLAQARSKDGDNGALGYAMVYAQWGNTAWALDWVELLRRQRTAELILLKQPMFDPLRKEPRFQAVMRELKFPD